MANILDILTRAQALRQETALNSITPDRAGGIMYDTLILINQMQLEGGSLLISKVYSSVAAMEADTTPTSDLTGRALRPGQLAVIVPSSSTSSDMGSVYRYNEPGSWTLCGKIGGLPMDTVPTEGSTNGITSGAVYQTKQALEGEVSQLENEINGSVHDEAIDQTLVAESYFNTNNSPLDINPSAVAGVYCCKIAVTPGEKYRIYGKSGTIYVLLYATTGSNRIAIRKANAGENHRTTPVDLTIEEGEAYLYVNLSSYDSQTDKVEKVVDVHAPGLISRVSDLETNLATTELTLASVKSANDKQEQETLQFITGASINLSGGIGTVIPNPATSYTFNYCRHSVSPGDNIIINGTGGTSNRLWGFVDADNEILSVADESATGNNLSITAPVNAVAIIINSSDISVASYYICKQGSLAERITENDDIIENNSAYISLLRRATEVPVKYSPTSREDNCYINKVGVAPVVPGSNSWIAFYDVSDKRIVRVSFRTTRTTFGSAMAYAFYPDNQLGSSPIETGPMLMGAYDADIIVPSGAKYIAFTLDIYNDTLSVYDLQTDIKILSGKTVVCFGDSMTEFSGTNDERKPYSYYLEKLTGANVINVGIGGTRLACRTTPVLSPSNVNEGYAAMDCPSLIDAATTQDFTIVEAGANYIKTQASDDNTAIVARLKAVDWSKVDIVTILIGCNDWSAGVDYGTPGQESKYTDLGAINYIIKTLLTAYPHLSVFWFSPIVRWMANSLEERTDANWAGVYSVNGRNLEQFVEGVIAEVKNNCIPVCDMYHTLGWNKYNFSQYFLDTDGVHPYKGFRQIANKFASFIYENKNF